MAKATDPKRESVAVRFSWGDGDTSDWSNWVASGETVAQSHSWKSPGSYDVMLQARDKQGATSGWSECHAVAVALPPGTLKWRYKVGGVVSSPAVVEGDIPVVCVCSFLIEPEYWKIREEKGYDGSWQCQLFDHWVHNVYSDGTLHWRCRLGPLTDHPYPIVEEDGFRVGTYLFRFSGELVSYGTETGLKFQAIGPDGTGYDAEWNTSLVAHAPDGTVKWGAMIGGGAWAGISIVETMLYEEGRPVVSLPAIGSDGTVYVGTWGGDVFAIKPDGTVMWEYETDDQIESSPAVGGDGVVYVGSNDGCLYAIKPDGRIKWRFKTGGPVRSSPAISSDGTVHVGSDDGYLYAIKPDGKLRWRYRTEGPIYSSPAIGSDGTAYFGSNDGYLYAVQGSAPLADSPWPKFRHDNQNSGRTEGPR